MANIPKNYPFDISDQDLERSIKDLVNDFVSSNTDKDGVLNLDPLKLSTFLSLGQVEVQKRVNKTITQEVNALRELIKEETASSKKVSRASFKLSKISIIIAAFSILASAYFSAFQWYREDVTIKNNLFFENSNNLGLYFQIKMNEQNQKYVVYYTNKFNTLYSRQYPHYNLDKLTEQCVLGYSSLINNFDLANTVIDEIRGIKQDYDLGNTKINNLTIEKFNKELIRYNHWIEIDINKLKDSDCRDFPSYEDYLNKVKNDG